MEKTRHTTVKKLNEFKYDENFCFGYKDTNINSRYAGKGAKKIAKNTLWLIHTGKPENSGFPSKQKPL